MNPIVDTVRIVLSESMSLCFAGEHAPSELEQSLESERLECFVKARTPVTAPTTIPAPPVPMAIHPIVR
jgi:hypothetical protein